MSCSSWTRTACCGSALGAVLGLLVVFVLVLNALTGSARPETREALAQQRSEASFQNMTRDEWVHRLSDADHVLGRIAVSQARAGDVENAKANVGKLEKLNKNIVRNVAVTQMLDRARSLTEPQEREKQIQAVLPQALALANAIEDPLLKADSLRYIADIQDQYLRDDKSKAEARALYVQAATAVLGRGPDPEVPAYTFNPLLLAWPLGLAVLAGLFFSLLRPLIASQPAAVAAPPAAAPSKASQEEEEEDEDDEEEEEEEARTRPVVTAAEPPAAPAPLAPNPLASSGFADEDDLSSLGGGSEPLAATASTEMPAHLAAAAYDDQSASMETSALLAPVPLSTSAAPGSKLMASAVQGQTESLAPKPAGKPAVATMLAKGAAARTQLAKSGQATKLADTSEALPLPPKG